MLSALLTAGRLSQVVIVQDSESYHPPEIPALKPLVLPVMPPDDTSANYVDLRRSGDWKAKNSEPFYMNIPKRRRRK
jgi:hypothetical protein